MAEKYISKITLPDGETYTIKGSSPDVSGKMDKANPVGTGSFSLNRKADTTVGTNSVAEGYNCTASGSLSHSEGWETTSSGAYSHSEGQQSVASGIASHAEGQRTKVSGTASHAEGSDTTVDGVGSHAEGYGTTARDYGSHAEGGGSFAFASYSHAEGYGTIANGENQHVQGKYNIADETSAHIVGNGTSTTRSNCHTLDWDGNAWYSGNVTAPYVYATSFVNKLATDDSGTSYSIIRHVKNASANNEMLHYYRNDATNNTAYYKIRLFNPADRTKSVDFDFGDVGGNPRFYIGGNQVPVIKSITMTQTTGTTGNFLIFGNNNTYNNSKIVSIDLTSTNTRGFTVDYGKNSGGQWYGHIHSVDNYTTSMANTSITYTVYYMD